MIGKSILIVDAVGSTKQGITIMVPEVSKNKIRKRIHSRIREKLAGSKARPRLNVYRSLNHIYAQVIDDA